MSFYVRYEYEKMIESTTKIVITEPWPGKSGIVICVQLHTMGIQWL